MIDTAIAIFAFIREKSKNLKPLLDDFLKFIESVFARAKDFLATFPKVVRETYQKYGIEIREVPKSPALFTGIPVKVSDDVYVLIKDGNEIFRGTKKEVEAIADKLKGMSDDVAKKYLDELTIRLEKIRKLNFKTKRIEEKYIGEELKDLEGLNDITSLSLKNKNRWCWPYSVKYLDEIERIKYKVTIKDGKLYNQKNELIQTLDAGTLSFKSQKAIFVMDRDGTIYLSNFFEPKYFHHSSFLAGKPVCAAGEVKVIAGEIIEVNIASGHYKPSFELNKQFLQFLEKEYNIKNVNLINEY